MQAVLRIISMALTTLMMTVFVLWCLAASPLLLFKFGVDWLTERLESKWPDSYRARVIPFWTRLLAPLAFLVILSAVLLLAIFHLRAKANSRG